MTEFTNTAHCRLGIHCATCRDLEGGRAWRGGLSKIFTLPAESIDFACPFGIAWGETPTRPVDAGPPPPPPSVVPYAEWSFAARYLARKRVDGEAGVGDTFKRLLGAGGRMIEWVAKRLDIDCGCASRQARWNATHPYSELPIT